MLGRDSAKTKKWAMAEITLVIGATARCSDGFSGEVKSLVVEPGARVVTHLVVEPGVADEVRSGLARFVPLDHVDASGDEIRLRYTEAEFKDLEPAEETLAVLVLGGPPVQLLPSGEGWRSAGGPVADGSTIQRIPDGDIETVGLVPETEAGTTEVEEGHGDHVHATDGDIGQLWALRIDSGDGRVTQVLLEAGHLEWDEVAIPIGHVAGFDDGIQLDITWAQVQELQPPG
jgi:hypothetical protein